MASSTGINVLDDDAVPADAPKRLAYSYIRYSSEQQMTKKSGEIGDSVRRQMRNHQIAVEKYNLHVMDVFQDLGKSAFRGKNRLTGALSVFLESLKKGLIPAHSYLLIESFDRLSRERTTDALSTVLSILRSKIKIITTDDLKLYDLSVKGKDLEQTIMITVLLERANDESETKSDRQKDKWIYRRERIMSGEKKFLNKNVPWWISLDEKTKEYSLIPERVAEIRTIFDLMMKQNLGLRAAAAHINQQNPLKVNFGRGATGNGWTARGIQRMLTTPSLYGDLELCEYVYDNDKATPDRKTIQVMEGFYPAAFSRDEIELIKAKIAGRMTAKEKPTRRDRQYYNVYHGLTKCAYCGGNVRFSQKQKYSYLVCRNSEINLCKFPKALSVQYQRFDEVFFKYAEHYNFERLVNSESKNNEAVTSEINTLESEIAIKKLKAQKFTANLFSMFDGDIPEEQQAVMIQSNREIKNLEAKLKKLRGAVTHDFADSKTISNAVGYAKDLMKSKDGRLELSNYLSSVIDKIVIDFGKPRKNDADYIKVFFRNSDYVHHMLMNKETCYSYDSDGELFLDTLSGVVREDGYYREIGDKPEWVDVDPWTDEEVAAADEANRLNPEYTGNAEPFSDDYPNDAEMREIFAEVDKNLS